MGLEYDLEFTVVNLENIDEFTFGDNYDLSVVSDYVNDVETNWPSLVESLCNGGEPALIQENDGNAEDSNEIAEYEGIWKSNNIFEPLLLATLPDFEMTDLVTRFIRHVGT